jgi:hypothetical protein
MSDVLSAETRFLDESFIDKPKAAAAINKSTRTLDRWDALGIGPPRIVVGRSVLYRKAAFIAWLESHERIRGCRTARRRG